jgi:hypothetical protein
MQPLLDRNIGLPNPPFLEHLVAHYMPELHEPGAVINAFEE